MEILLGCEKALVIKLPTIPFSIHWRFRFILSGQASNLGPHIWKQVLYHWAASLKRWLFWGGKSAPGCVQSLLLELFSGITTITSRGAPWTIWEAENQTQVSHMQRKHITLCSGYPLIFWVSHTWQFSGITPDSELRNYSGSARGTQWDAGDQFFFFFFFHRSPAGINSKSVTYKVFLTGISLWPLWFL